MKINDFTHSIKSREGLVQVINKDNTQILCMPDGTVIPAQVWSRVSTNVKEAPYVIVKLFVEIK